MAKYTREELQQFREEIVTFKSRKKLFRGLGWACIGLSILLAIIFAVNGVESAEENPLLYFSSFLFATGILLFILKGAIYNQRIKNRRRIIQEAKEEHAIDEMFDKENRDH